MDGQALGTGNGGGHIAEKEPSGGKGTNGACGVGEPWMPGRSELPSVSMVNKMEE